MNLDRMVNFSFRKQRPRSFWNSLIGPPDGTATDFEDSSHSEPGMTTSISEPFETIDGVIPWLFEEPDLLLTAEELGDHIYTTDPANLKKLTRKDIKRQSAIRELINTERHYVNRLKIIQKIFAHTMITKLKYTEEQVNKFFPGIDELVEIHNKFLYQLLGRQATREDRFVDQIGDILLDQFQGASADKMTSVYGVFCCNHNDAMQLYKEFLKNDRNFQIFAKYCHSLPFCEKREIPDFILGVTVRLCKYWILIDGILKYTEDKKERRLLEQASQASKTVLHNVNHKVESYEKLINIQSKLELKTVTFRDKKFKRQDLTANNRQLVHVGNIGWKSARGRVAEIVAVVLTDIIVFLQQNEQKYTFFMQDNKSCVIPLHDLLVREKGDVRGSLGIYMIIQNPASPELYELVCKSKKEREEWITILQHAIAACRKDVKSKTSQAGSREVILSKPVNISRELEVASKVKSLVEQLHQKDEMIRGYCEDKNKLMLELLQLSTSNTTRLTSILQNTESHMNRSISAEEDCSKPHVTIPRRAETFSGFDNSYSSSKVHRRTHTVTDISNVIEEMPTQTGSTSEEKDRRYSDTPNNILESEYDSHSWEIQVNSGIPSEHDSMEELSAADMSSRIPTPPTFDQMASMSQLVEYLDSLMTITTKQFTIVGSLQAELAGAKKEISRLLADVHGRHSMLYRHDQLEELRQLQGNLTLEKQQWVERKLFFYSSLQTERENIESERRQIEREKMNLRNDQKALRKERDLMRSELIRMSEQGFQASRTFDDSFDEDGLENADSSRSVFEQRHLSHLRSACEDTYDTVAVGGPDMYSPYAWVTADEFPYQPLESVGSPEDYISSTIRQDSFPFYSMGTNYEEGISGRSHQSFQVNTDINPSQNEQSATASVSPPNMPHHLSSRDSSAGLSRAESMSSASRTAFRQKKNSHSGPSYPPWNKKGK